MTAEEHMMKRVTAVLLAGALIAGTASVASADYGHGHHRSGCEYGNRFTHMQKTLGLSDQQVTKLKEIRDKYRPQQKKLRDQMRANRDQMRALMDKGNASDASVRKLADATGKLKSDMIVLRADMHEEMNKVYTPAQLEKRKELRNKWREKHREWREHHGMQ
jgi:Spy/CpxP family protein refolding chaperone